MNHLIVEKAAGQEVSPAFLDQALTKFDGCAGITAVVVTGEDAELRVSQFDTGAKLEDVMAFFKENKDIPVLACFGEPAPTDDSIQPFTLFEQEVEVKNEKGETTKETQPVLVAMVSGPYPQFKQPDDARTEHYHLTYSELVPTIEAIWDRHDGNLDAIMAELEGKITQSYLKGLSTGDGTIVLMAQSGKIIKVTRDLARGTFSWGWTSDPLGYFEGTATDQGGKPKAFGFAGKPSAAPAPAPAPAPKAVAPEPVVQRKKVVVPDAPAGTGPQPTIGDTRNVTQVGATTVIRKPKPVPATTETATAVKPDATARDLVWVSPPMSGSDNTNQYKHRFYGIYCGKKETWPEELTNGAAWKNGKKILVERAKVRAEHVKFIKELSGLERVANAEAKLTTPNTDAYKPFTPPADDKTANDDTAFAIEQTEMNSVEEYITSTLFKAMTDKENELIAKPDEWAKVQDRHPTYTQRVGLTSIYDTLPYSLKALRELGNISPGALAILCLEWKMEALKNRPAAQQKSKQTEITVTSTKEPAVPGTPPVIRRKVVNT